MKDSKRVSVASLIKEERIFIGDGYRAKNSELAEEGLPFARAGNLNNGFQFEGADCIPFSDVAKVGNKRSVVGDVAFTSKGTIGRFGFVNEYTQEFVYSPQLCFWRSLDFESISSQYLYYWMNSALFLHQVAMVSGQTDMAPYVNLRDQRRMYIDLPSLPIQKKIASILSAYDELIENNNQRIQLLETMAEEIYKEWFVRLRFPGYQDTPVVDGVPEGWEKKSFEEVAEFINGYAFKPSDWKEEGIPIVKIAELKNGVTDKTPRNNGLDIPQKYHVSQGDLLFSWSADLEAYLWNEGAGLLNQHIFKVVPYQKIPKEFVFYSLKVKMEIFKSMSNGATMQHIKRSELGRVFLEIPSDSVLRRFEEIVSPIIKEVGILKSKNNILQETRDLLLPRLISGKLSVEHLLKDDQPTKLNQRLEPVS